MLDNRVELFKSYMGQLIHDSTSVYFDRLSEYPIDIDFLMESSFYTGAFACAYWALPLKEGEARTDVRGCFLQWKKLDRDELVKAYCSFLNSMIEIKAMERATRGTVYLPNIYARKGEISAKLEEINKKFEAKKCDENENQKNLTNI